MKKRVKQNEKLPDGMIQYTISSHFNKCTLLIITEHGETAIHVLNKNANSPVLYEEGLVFQCKTDMEDYIDSITNDILDTYIPRHKNQTGNWQPLSDGWFNYYYCSLCGYKTMTRCRICQNCKAEMTNSQLSGY